jgi:hypothetical protein
MKPASLIAIIFMLASPLLFAQEERTEIAGVIRNVQQMPLGGITIFNKQSQEGTITNNQGKFRIDVKPGDRLLMQALQYEYFTLVVTESSMKVETLEIMLKEGVNLLDEVEVLDASIQVLVVPNKDYNATLRVLEDEKVTTTPSDREEEILSSTRVREPSEYKLEHVAANQNGLRTTMFDALGFIRDQVTDQDFKNQPLTLDGNSKKNKQVNSFLLNKYKPNFLEEFLELNHEDVTNFVYFAQDAGLNQEMLKPENEMQTLEWLQNQAVVFKQRQKSGTKLDKK